MDVGGYTFALVCKCSARLVCSLVGSSGCAGTDSQGVLYNSEGCVHGVSEPFVERARCGSQRGVKSVVWFCDRGLRDSNKSKTRSLSNSRWSRWHLSALKLRERFSWRECASTGPWWLYRTWSFAMQRIAWKSTHTA